jgi:hypothetical protein
VSAPLSSAEDLRLCFGLLPLAFAWDEDEGQLDELLGPLLLKAMDEARIYSIVVDGLYDSATRTASQTRVLGEIEKNLAAAAALRRPRVMKALGIHEPLQMESAAEIAEEADRLRADAYTLLANLTASVGDTTRTVPFARPAFGASTFTHAEGDRTPSERNLLADETDDVSSYDLVNG